MPPSPTPVPPTELVAAAGELRALMDELAGLTGCGDAWGMRVLRRNVELALLSPGTLADADNQADFVEELAGAIWDPVDSGFRHAVRPSAQDACRRDERRRDIVERLDELAHGLCVAVERWREEVDVPAADRSVSPG